jgi:hypothetical protein
MLSTRWLTHRPSLGVAIAPAGPSHANSPSPHPKDNRKTSNYITTNTIIPTQPRQGVLLAQAQFVDVLTKRVPHSDCIWLPPFYPLYLAAKGDSFSQPLVSARRCATSRGVVRIGARRQSWLFPEKGSMPSFWVLVMEFRRRWPSLLMDEQDRTRIDPAFRYRSSPSRYSCAPPRSKAPMNANS